MLHANILKPTVSWYVETESRFLKHYYYYSFLFFRMEFSWDEREADFERYRRPPCISPIPPSSIHLAGQSRANELAEFTQKERETWQSKMVVDNPSFSVIRQGTSTELCGQASCQTDKLQSILKHQPIKVGLASTERLRVDRIPALSVLAGREDEEQTRKVVGFVPGPHSNHSLRLNYNTIPIPRENSNPKEPHLLSLDSKAVAGHTHLRVPATS